MSAGSVPPGNIPPGSWFAGGYMDSRKFTDYLLSPTHSVGRHKARLWSSVFGLGPDDWTLLESLIRSQVAGGVVTERNPTSDLRHFEVVIPDFVTPQIAPRTAPVITAWVAEHGDVRDVLPRFVTAYPDVP